MTDPIKGKDLPAPKDPVPVQDHGLRIGKSQSLDDRALNIAWLKKRIAEKEVCFRQLSVALKQQCVLSVPDDRDLAQGQCIPIDVSRDLNGLALDTTRLQGRIMAHELRSEQLSQAFKQLTERVDNLEGSTTRSSTSSQMSK